jgi:hypothetical protein
MPVARAGSVDGMSTDTRRKNRHVLDALGGAPVGSWVIDPAHSSARTRLGRTDLGVGEGPVEGSRIVVGDDVDIQLDLEAALEEADAA